MKKNRLHSDCISCIARKETEKYPEGITEAQKLEYKRAVFKILGNAKNSDSAPLLVKYIADLQTEMFGKGYDYTETKKYFNDYVMKKIASVEENVFKSEDALYRALQYSMTGNYVDFGTPFSINEEKFDELIDESKNITFDAKQYASLKNDLYHAKKLVVLLDNCGEIVFDKVLIKALKAFYPSLEITAVVRGFQALNDATMEDAKQIGLTEIVKVIGNGTDIAGTVLDHVNAETKKALEEADVIISKGLGNFETINGCGLNIYYLFMCKCAMFANRFKKNLYEGLLINEHSVEPLS